MKVRCLLKLLAITKFVAWWILDMIGMGLIYVSVISEGLRTLIPSMGQKLWKIPGLGALKDYEGTYKLDLAPFMAVFIFIAVTYLWDEILELWLLRHPTDGPWKPDNQEMFVVGLGAVILGADIVLFYCGLTQMGWGGNSLSFSALVGTAAYVGILLFFTYVSINLRLQLRSVIGRKKECFA